MYPSKSGWQACSLEDPLNVNQLRESVGLQPLEDWIKESESESSGFSEHDEEEYQKGFDQWCKNTGWRK